METDKCLSDEEFDGWVRSKRLAAVRKDHLNKCAICKALGDQLAAFDPRAAARRILSPQFGEGVSLSRHRLTVGSMVIGMAALVMVILVQSNNLKGSQYARAFFERSANSTMALLADREEAAIGLQEELAKLNVPKSERLSLLLRQLDASEEPTSGAMITVDNRDKPVATIGGSHFDLRDADDKEAAMAGIKRTLSEGKRVRVYLTGRTADSNSMRVAFDTLSEQAIGDQTVTCVAALTRARE